MKKNLKEILFNFSPWTSAFIIILTLCVIGSCVSLPFWKPDNIIEEVAEDVIEYKTGIDIDFSPSTPEHPLLRRN